MILMSADNAESLFLQGLVHCKNGFHVAPRQLQTMEARDSVVFELTNPKRNLVTNPYRKLNYTFGLFESIAMWNGINDVKIFNYYNKNMAKYSDDGATFYGSYGEEFTAQFTRILRLLGNDRDSRQAVITIWKKNPPESKDIPCTVMLHFLVRDFHLNLNVYMRSNDIWLGFPYDITNFSRIQQSVAAVLGFKVGVLRHMVGSLHMYTTDLYKVENALKYQGPTIVEVPLVEASDLFLLRDIAEDARNLFTSRKYQTLSNFCTVHRDLLNAHAMLSLRSQFPQPYDFLITEAKRIHGYFKDSA